MSAPRHWDQDKDSTLYIGNLDERCTDSIIWELMLQAGPIVNVHLPKDRVTQSHQGYGFVEFANEESADYGAKVMNQIRLFGKQIRVNKATADKRSTSGAAGADGASQGVGAELFVGNLDSMVDEKVLYETFSRFGPLLAAPKITRDDSNLSKGYGFISYATFEASDDAIANMHGQYLSNKEITVQYAYKKDGKVERHGDAAERALAAQAKKHGVQIAIPAMPASLVGAPTAPTAPPVMNGTYGAPAYGGAQAYSSQAYATQAYGTQAYGTQSYGIPNQGGQMPPPQNMYPPNYGGYNPPHDYKNVPPPLSLSAPNRGPLQQSWAQQQPSWYPPQSVSPSMPGYYAASGWPPQPQTPGYYPTSTSYQQHPTFQATSSYPPQPQSYYPTTGSYPPQQQQGYYSTAPGYPPQPQSYQGMAGYPPQQQNFQGPGFVPPPPARQASASRRAASPNQTQNSAYQAPSNYNVQTHRNSNNSTLPAPSTGLPARPPTPDKKLQGTGNVRNWPNTGGNSGGNASGNTGGNSTGNSAGNTGVSTGGSTGGSQGMAVRQPSQERRETVD